MSFKLLSWSAEVLSFLNVMELWLTLGGKCARICGVSSVVKENSLNSYLLSNIAKCGILLIFDTKGTLWATETEQHLDWSLDC